MPRGDKSAYTEKQKRQAEHIEEGYRARGVPEEEAERLGDREQDVRRRPEERSGTRKEDEQGSGTERRPDRRSGFGLASEIGAVRFGAEGRRDAETEGDGGPEAHHPLGPLTGAAGSRRRALSGTAKRLTHRAFHRAR
jgi:hypothetical protein